MPYITQADFTKRFGEDELDDLTEGNSFASAATDASTLIDGYLASRYTLPLTSVPDIVKAWACDIARFKLWDEKAPEEVRARYDDVLAQLKDLAKGLLSLPPGSDGEKPAGSANGITGYSNTRLFTEDTLAGF